MFIKELYKAIGIELEVHNIIVDYTSANGQRTHSANHIIANRIQCTDSDIVKKIKESLPKGSRVCAIVEISGEYELSELERLAGSEKLLYVESRWLYHDMKLVQEYAKEFAQEGI